MTFNDHAHLMGLIFPESLNQASEPLNNMSVPYNLWGFYQRDVDKSTHEQPSIKVKTFFYALMMFTTKPAPLDAMKRVRVTCD